MRVFYVGPSDNGNYGVEEALAPLCLPPDRLDVALFRGLRQPLEPVNYDPAEHGFANLGRYDLVILAGVDPMVLSPQATLALVAFVERGGGLMLLGGSHSFGNAEGTYLPLAPVLPVVVLRGLDVEVNAPVRPADHPIARGLPEPLGYAAKVHAIEVKPAAQVALTAADFPLVVAGDYEYGRVVVVASYPECGETEYGWFFTGDAFDDFLRNAIAWMTKEHHWAWIESFSLPNRQLAPGTESFGKLALLASEPTEVRLTTRLARATGEVVQETVSQVRVEARHEALFSFRAPEGQAAVGLHYGTVVATGLDGLELGRRDVAIEVLNPTRATIELRGGRRVRLPGEPLSLRVSATRAKVALAQTTVELTLLDADGRVVARADRRPLKWNGDRTDGLEMELASPPLRPGAYRLRAELRLADEVADLAEEPIHVIGRASGEGRFPLIAEGAYHLDRASADRSVRSLAATGVNALSLPGPAMQEWGERPHGEAMLRHVEEQALRAGMALAHHRHGLVLGLSPSAPLAPCPLTAAFRETLDEKARPALLADGRVPRLLFHEVVPQTAVREGQLCRCEACLLAFEGAYGRPMPEGDATGMPPATHHALCSFVSSYWWHVYSAAQKLRDESAGGVRLSLPFSSASFLREGRRSPYCDAFSWVRACDLVEVAAEQPEAAWRLSLSGHRALCGLNGKPFGALIDLAAGAMPPSEAAFMALAHGASHLRVAENPRFLFWSRQEPLERALGRVFVRIGRIAPLLACSRRPPARLALLFPFTQMVDRGSEGLLDAHELLGTAFGEVDLVHQRFADEEKLSHYAAVAILGARVLPRKTTKALADYVERGGLLLADDAELADEDGTPIAWPEGLFGAAETPVFEAVTRRRRAFGAGRTTLFSSNLTEAWRRAVREEDAQAVGALRRAVADALLERGIRPRARSSNPAVEIGLREAEETWLLVAVNHSDEAQDARLSLDLGPAAFAFDLATGEAQRIERAEGASSAEMAIRLAPRDGGLWALYPERPFALRLEMPQEAFRGGEELRYRILVVNDAGQQVKGCQLVRVAVADPAGEERPDLGGDRVARNGVLDVAEPLGANERPGRWTLCATDFLTRRIARRTFEVAAGRDTESPKSP